MILESKGCKIEIRAEESLLEQIIEGTFLYEHIPCVAIGSGDADAYLTIERGNFHLEFDFPTVSYRNEILDYRNIVGMAGYLLERLRQEKRIYTLHSNAIDIQGNGVVIFGPPHCGKTTLSLLLAKAYGGKVICNERTLLELGEDRISGSLASIGLNRFTKREVQDYEGLIGSGNQELRMFVHPFLGGGKEVIPYSHDAAVWEIIQETDIFIRGINHKVKKGTDSYCLLPSLDTEELAAQRYHDLSSMLKRFPCYTISGTYDTIIEQIGRLLFEEGDWESDYHGKNFGTALRGRH